jgi:hypothetical protein
MVLDIETLPTPKEIPVQETGAGVSARAKDMKRATVTTERQEIMLVENKMMGDCRSESQLYIIQNARREVHNTLHLAS